MKIFKETVVCANYDSYPAKPAPERADSGRGRASRRPRERPADGPLFRVPLGNFAILRADHAQVAGRDRFAQSELLREEHNDGARVCKFVFFRRNLKFGKNAQTVNFVKRYFKLPAAVLRRRAAAPLCNDAVPRKPEPLVEPNPVGARFVDAARVLLAEFRPFVDERQLDLLARLGLRIEARPFERRR